MFKIRLPLQTFSVTKTQDLCDYHESSPKLEYNDGEKMKIKNCKRKSEHLTENVSHFEEYTTNSGKSF